MAEPFYISNSTLNAWLSCGTKGLLYKHHRLTTPDERGHRTAGSMAHEAIAHYLRSLGDAQGALEWFDDHYKPFSDEYLSEPVLIYKREVPNRLRHANLRLILEEWFDRNRIADLSFEIIPGLIEIPFSFPLSRDGTIYIRGIMDAIVRDKHSKRLRVLDHKTTGRLSDPWWAKWSMEAELTEYAWAAAQHLGESKLDLAAGLDILINGLEFSELPSSDRRCPTHGMKFHQCQREHVEFGMRTFKRTRAEINTWGKNALAAARAFKAECERLPALADLDKADIRGAFHGACLFCDYRKFCELGRPPGGAEAMFVPAGPSPFETQRVNSAENVPPQNASE